VPALPTQGGPAWRELTSEHFTVWTDAEPALAHALIMRMEHIRQVLFGVSFFRVQARSRTVVVAFQSMREAHAFIDDGAAGETGSPDGPLLQPTMIVDAATLDYNPRVLTHELTHVISLEAIPHQPQWFGEAIASYFETLELDEHTGAVQLGAPYPLYARMLHSGFGISSARLVLDCNESPCWETDNFYPTVWLLFSYLVDNHEAHLLQYMQRLIETPRSAQKGLWPEVFPDLPASALDHELSVWLATGEVRVRKFHVTLQQSPVAQRTLSDADVLALRGLLRDFEARHRLHPLDSVPAEIRDALRLDPTNVIARMVEAADGSPLTADLARPIVAAHPTDWRAWWLLWKGLQPGSEADDAHHKVCELLPLNPAWLPDGFCRAP
jgi:hypothetical protein